MGDWNEAMGQKLQELRQAAGLSQSQLASAAGVPVGTLKNWEQGRRMPMFDAAYRLAKAMNITLDELAGRVFEVVPSTEPTPRKAPPAGKPARKRKGK